MSLLPFTLLGKHFYPRDLELALSVLLKDATDMGDGLGV